MTHEEAVKLIDASATLVRKIAAPGIIHYRIEGSNWETPYAFTPDHAWKLAVYKAASLPVPEVL